MIQIEKYIHDVFFALAEAGIAETKQDHEQGGEGEGKRMI